jgi:hypothetical protein
LECTSGCAGQQRKRGLEFYYIFLIKRQIKDLQRSINDALHYRIALPLQYTKNFRPNGKAYAKTGVWSVSCFEKSGKGVRRAGRA